MQFLRSTGCVLLILFLVVPIAGIAQEPEAGGQSAPSLDSTEWNEADWLNVSRPSTYVPENITGVDCFDYYQFGSVDIDIAPTLSGTVSGAPVHFEGTIRNNNKYPLVDGALYAKIFREDENVILSNGHPVVDQFFAVENLVIPAGDEVPVSFDWNVPRYAESGNYYLASFFSTSKKFNLAGLPFTDDVVGGTYRFKVSGEIEGGVVFDKNSVTVDGPPYFFANPTPKVSATDPIVVSATLSNTTGETQSVGVEKIVYRWDQQLDSNEVFPDMETVGDTQTLNNTEVIIDPSITDPKILNEIKSQMRVRDTEMFTLAPGEKRTIEATVTNTDSAVYLVVLKSYYKDTNSILNVRFTRKDVSTTRINFPSVLSYPLKAGTEETLFSCVHGAGTMDIIENNQLTLALVDENGEEIHSYTYEGAITGAMMGVADTFVPNKTYENFTLKATLTHEGTVVDEAEITYRCESIDPSKCPAEMAATPAKDDEGDNRSLLIIVLGALLLGAAGVIYLVMSLKGKNSEEETPKEEASEES